MDYYGIDHKLCNWVRSFLTASHHRRRPIILSPCYIRCPPGYSAWPNPISHIHQRHIRQHYLNYTTVCR
jgi:hypothetical protein